MPRVGPAVKALVTSRERLRLTAEHVYQVPPLSLSRGVGESGRREATSRPPDLPTRTRSDSSSSVRRQSIGRLPSMPATASIRTHLRLS
jgi:hypothetical protein